MDFYRVTASHLLIQSAGRRYARNPDARTGAVAGAYSLTTNAYRRTGWRS